MATCPKCDGAGVVPEGEDLEECGHCGGIGTVDPGEEDDRWEEDVDRGIQAHRERYLD